MRRQRFWRRQPAAAGVAARLEQTITADDLLGSPFVLMGTIDEMTRQILHTQERYGSTHFTVHARTGIRSPG